MGAKLKYIEYKYELLEKAIIQTSVVGYHIEWPEEHLKLEVNGILTLDSGFKWDGTTGGIDTKEGYRGSAAHDAIYRCMRSNLIPLNQRQHIDEDLRDIWLTDGVNPFMVWYRYYLVRGFGEKFARPPEKPVRVYQFVN